MEKKTLGKFIATLRKERGMTQKELGEKLFVTDKTVSRWECDESAPELSLLPVIAELFGVTTDELLRGERKTSEREEAKETSPKQSEERGEKYFRQLLRRQKKRFIEFSLLSVGLTATGVIVAAICNFCFYRASLGFCLACVFFVAAAICQLIFTLNGRLPIEDAESATRRAEMQRINSEIVLCSVRVFCGIFCALSACAAGNAPVKLLRVAVWLLSACGGAVLCGWFFCRVCGISFVRGRIACKKASDFSRHREKRASGKTTKIAETGCMRVLRGLSFLVRRGGGRFRFGRKRRVFEKDGV